MVNYPLSKANGIAVAIFQAAGFLRKIFMPSRFRQVNEVCLRRRKSRYTPGAKTAGPSPEKGDTGGAWILSAPNEENARRAECPPPCNSPASRRGADGSSFASYLLRGLPPMADFRPGGQGRFGAFLRPQCRSRGVSDPVSFRQAPDRFPAFAVPAAQHPRT